MTAKDTSDVESQEGDTAAQQGATVLKEYKPTKPKFGGLKKVDNVNFVA